MENRDQTGAPVSIWRRDRVRWEGLVKQELVMRLTELN